jgi:hypothetical protein
MRRYVSVLRSLTERNASWLPEIALPFHSFTGELPEIPLGNSEFIFFWRFS